MNGTTTSIAPSRADRQPPQPWPPAVAAATLDRVRLKREEVLNGLIHEYKRAA
jgi:hypothetical protein